MGHPKRFDEPGAWHHVMNRGVGRRTMFDNDEDARGFLALLAKISQRGLLKPVAFSLLPNHFHLLAWSPEGRLGDAMQFLEGIYGRGFNRRRDRDGTLVRARYRSKVVRSDAYRVALVGYIDQNPVDAGLVADPMDYPFGSARLYARASGPLWLDRAPIQELACRRSGLPLFGRDAYERAFGGAARAARSRWVKSAMESNRPDDVSLDELIAASPDYVRRWLDERGLEADGTGRCLPVADVDSVSAVVGEASMARPDWFVNPRGRRRPAWTIAAVGLLRTIAGQTFRQIGVRLSMAGTVARDLGAEHQGLLGTDTEYAAVFAMLVRASVVRCHGLPGSPPESV